MNIIEAIRRYFEYLPEKDKKIASKLLDDRKFADLKELVDSDVTKLAKKVNLDEDESMLTKEELLILEKYNNLKELQDIVDEQAEPFLEDDESFYDPPLTDLEDYYA